MLSTLHQSSLGALFLLAKDKIHPLWYSPYIPLFFFVSSIVAGLSMVIVESALSHRAFRDQLDPATARRSRRHHARPRPRRARSCSSPTSSCGCRGFLDGGALGSAAHARTAHWFLFEMFGFMLAPVAALRLGGAHRNVDGRARRRRRWTVLGVVVNRHQRVGRRDELVAIRRRTSRAGWRSSCRSPSSRSGILTFRWIVNRMPVLRETRRIASRRH